MGPSKFDGLKCLIIDFSAPPRLRGEIGPFPITAITCDDGDYGDSSTPANKSVSIATLLGFTLLAR